MMNHWLILDASALVALLNNRDAYHLPCLAALEQARTRMRLISTEAVVAEACHLLRRHHPASPRRCLQLLLDLKVDVAPLLPPGIPRLLTLMAKYEDAPMDFADAGLVVLAEQLSVRRIFTLDRRHFLTYRLFGRHSFEIVP